MTGCTQITDKAFENLRGINTLDMSGCTTITDKAFENLRGIRTLHMCECDQITDEAQFENLRGINTLVMYKCRVPSIASAKRVLGNVITCFGVGVEYDTEDEF